ncbi:VanZ family protein [Pseudochrobactrum sp. HB0163]|uniref:VanZ family protein n=1 Tax=Pseudochrobactrum sp. HB0163 TaxID=3450708 RepID=UPI003F6E1D54
MRPFPVFQILAWLMLFALLVVTISPIGLRPHIPGFVNGERFAMLMIIGLLFSLAYPKHWIKTLFLLIAVSALFELMQRLTPDRHGEFSDFVIKSAGAIAGVLLGKTILFWKNSLK